MKPEQKKNLLPVIGITHGLAQNQRGVSLIDELHDIDSLVEEELSRNPGENSDEISSNSISGDQKAE